MDLGGSWRRVRGDRAQLGRRPRIPTTAACGSAPQRERPLAHPLLCGVVAADGTPAACRALSLTARLGWAGFTTRNPGEPSWHRRARRARAEARVLVRLDAARDRLSRHHSAAFGGMQRRNGGGNLVGGGNFHAARQLLLSLLDGAAAGHGQGPRGGLGGPRAGGRQGSLQRQRSGEWACVCGVPTNCQKWCRTARCYGRQGIWG